MIHYRQFRPGTQLAPYIECYWILHSPAGSLAPEERLIPGGRIEWMFNFESPLAWQISEEDPRGRVLEGSFLMGQRDRLYFVRGTGRTHLLGIRFRPGGWGAFSDHPAEDLLNKCIPCEEVFANLFNSLESQLNFCPDDLEKLGILESELLKRLKNPSSTYRQAMDIIQSLRQMQDADPVQEFCTFHKLYYKKLERLFLKYVGYTPKSYFRLLRFNRALRQIHRRKDFLTSIALDCGYYDQSHFIKDFKQFTGLSPGRFEPDQHKVSGFLVREQPV